MKESDLIKKYRLIYSENGNRLFRVNSGRGWTGKIINNKQCAKTKTLTLENPRPFYGMPAGTPDTIGWESITITPDMVGQKIAIFTAIEFKTKSYKKVTQEQQDFLELVKSSGGIAKVIRE